MNLSRLLNSRNNVIDLTEQRMLFDTSWPLVFLFLAATYVVTWSIGLLSIDLSTVLWITFSLAIIYQVLARILDFIKNDRAVIILYTTINIVTITGLAIVWSQIGGLAAPAFVFFFALPIIAMGLISRLGIQFVITLYSIVLAWFVALQQSADLRLQMEQTGVTPVWNLIPGLYDQNLVGIGVIGSGPAQFQYMLVFSFVLVGVFSTSAIVVSLIRLLIRRLKFVSVSGDRAEKLAASFLTHADGFELLIDCKSFQILALNTRLAEQLNQSPASLIGCHYSSALPYSLDHPVSQLIENGNEAKLAYQVFSTTKGEKLMNVRVSPGETDGFEFIRVTLNFLQESDYAKLAIDVFDDVSGAVDSSGNIIYQSEAAKFRFPVHGERASADLLPLPAGWWQIGKRRQHTRRILMGRAEYVLNLHRLEYPFEKGATELTVFRISTIKND